MPIGVDDYKHAQDHAQQLRGLYQERLEMYEDIEDIYLIEDDDLPDAEWIKDTLSPDGRNKIDGAKRLLTAADPTWKVPKETNTEDVSSIADQLERAAATTWRRAGVLQNRPRHYDAALSGVLYSEVQIALQSTKAIAALTQGGARKRAERVARQIPVVYEYINPKYGYPGWDALGLNAHASERELSVAAIRNLYGPGAVAGRNPTDTVRVWDYWNLDFHCAWVEGEKEYLVADSHDLGYIPIVAVQCEGSMLFTDEGQYQTQPLLYTVWRSNLWKRQNLYLTIAASLAFEIGANPLLVFQGDVENPPRPDYGQNPGGMIMIRPGETLTPLMQKILDPTLIQMAGEVDRRFDESTIYSQTLGEPLGANAPYSMVHMLSQSGRLPLVVYQRMIGFALGQAMTYTFATAKREGFNLMASTKTGLSELKAADIPDDIDLRCDLQIDMPQDERMNVQIAVEGVKMGLFSLEYAREHYLNIGQSPEMDDQIAEEQLTQAMTQVMMQQAQQQIAAPPQQPAQAPPDMMPPEMMQGQQVPDMGGGVGAGAVDGLPMMEGMEPLGSPMGPGGMPPEEEML